VVASVPPPVSVVLVPSTGVPESVIGAGLHAKAPAVKAAIRLIRRLFTVFLVVWVECDARYCTVRLDDQRGLHHDATESSRRRLGARVLRGIFPRAPMENAMPRSHGQLNWTTLAFVPVRPRRCDSRFRSATRTHDRSGIDRLFRPGPGILRPPGRREHPDRRFRCDDDRVADARGDTGFSTDVRPLIVDAQSDNVLNPDAGCSAGTAMATIERLPVDII
jgi:hypothetical protein